MMDGFELLDVETVRRLRGIYDSDKQMFAVAARQAISEAAKAHFSRERADAARLDESRQLAEARERVNRREVTEAEMRNIWDISDLPEGYVKEKILALRGVGSFTTNIEAAVLLGEERDRLRKAADEAPQS